MGLNFTAIDFETANEQRASVCEVGLTQVRDGAIVKTTSWRISPPTGDRFTNTWIHGINANDVRDALTWAQTAPLIEQSAEGHPLVAYNSPFDRGVYVAATRHSEITAAEHVWRDARVLAKTHLTLERYRLKDVTHHLGIPLTDHHHAGADAEACARVVLNIAGNHGASTLGELWPVTAPTVHSGVYEGYQKLPLPNGDAAPGHPLHGASITFTGGLDYLTRPEAQGAAATLGAKVTSSPTRTTNVVVLGWLDPATFRPGATTSAKHQAALDLITRGSRLDIITEQDFLALLAYEPER